ncbi:MAG TPA: transketolase, partial [Firmicutes bacterium]|nr:transketolase [Bacillota bacterium]
EELTKAYDEAMTVKGKPTMVIAKTVKGKGVSFIENQVDWHGKAPNDEEYKKAMAELEEAERRLG